MTTGRPQVWKVSVRRERQFMLFVVYLACLVHRKVTRRFGRVGGGGVYYYRAPPSGPRGCRRRTRRKRVHMRPLKHTWLSPLRHSWRSSCYFRRNELGRRLSLRKDPTADRWSWFQWKVDKESDEVARSRLTQFTTSLNLNNTFTVIATIRNLMYFKTPLRN